MHCHSMTPHFMSPPIVAITPISLPSHPSPFYRVFTTREMLFHSSTCYVTTCYAILYLFCHTTISTSGHLNSYNIILVYHGRPGKSNCNLNDIDALLNNPSSSMLQRHWVGLLCLMCHNSWSTYTYWIQLRHDTIKTSLNQPLGRLSL